MNERLKRNLNDFKNAFYNLKIGVEKAKTELEIDGAIKRFELCYELAWKLIKNILANMGIICKNPRECFKQAVINELIENQDIWLGMIEDRNELVHLYQFANSRKIFENIKAKYINSFTFLLRKAKELEDE